MSNPQYAFLEKIIKDMNDQIKEHAEVISKLADVSAVENYRHSLAKHVQDDRRFHAIYETTKYFITKKEEAQK